MATNKNQQTPTQESISKLEAGVLKYKKVISISVVAVIVVVAGLILLNTLYLKPRQAEASTALAKGQELFAQQQYEAALNGDKTGYIGFLRSSTSTDAQTPLTSPSFMPVSATQTSANGTRLPSSSTTILPATTLWYHQLLRPHSATYTHISTRLTTL